MSAAMLMFLGVAVVFFALAKANARPGFAALAVGICMVFMPLFSRRLPGHGDARDAAAVLLFLAAATVGHALGGGLKPHDDHDQDHMHDH